MLAVKKEKLYLLAATNAELEFDTIKESINFAYGSKVPVVHAKDGVDATSKIHYQSFSCIVLDIDLGKKSFEAVINSIRSCHLNESTPIILLVNEPEFKLEKTYPFVYFCEKPIDPKKFMELTSQQLKLGKGDQRICASLLNIICQAISEFSQSYAKEEYQLEGPYLTNSNDSLLDVNIIMEVKHDKAKTNLLMSINEKNLQNMKSQLKFLENLKMDHIARSLALFTLRRAVAQFANPYKVSTKIELAPEQLTKKFANKKGIGFSLQKSNSEKINLFVLPD